MLISSMINQGEGGGLDLIWILLPLLCCVMMMTQRGERRPVHETVTESSFTVEDIDTTYKTIERETAGWQREMEEGKGGPTPFASKLRWIIGGGKAEERFVVRESVPPRLHRLDDSTGPIYFELTEVEGGGTVVKTTYNPAIKSRMAKFKASLPLKIPATPIGDNCPSCGKPVLREFNVCPYCGEKMLKA